MSNPAIPEPRPPATIRWAGFIAVLAAVVDGFYAFGSTFWSLGVLKDKAGEIGPKAVEYGSTCLWIGFTLCILMSLYGLVAGLTLLMGARFGRVLAYGLLALALLAGFGCAITHAVGKNLVELGMQDHLNASTGFGYRYVEVKYLPPSPILGVIAGLTGTVLVSLSSASAWAHRRGDWAPPGTEPGLAAADIAPTNKCAILSLILAFVPMLLLTQLASIILGIVALVQIGRAKTPQRGRWMAWVGLAISSLVWLVALLALVAAICYAVWGKKPQPAPPPEPDPVVEPYDPEPVPVEPAPATDITPPADVAPEIRVEFRLARAVELEGWEERPFQGEALYLSPDIILHGRDIVRVSQGENDFGNPTVHLTLTEEAGARLNAVSSLSAGLRMAMVVDGQILTAPTLAGPVGSRMEISGGFTREEAARIVEALRPRD